MISFDISEKGPKWTYENLSITFKPAEDDMYTEWSAKNSPFAPTDFKEEDGKSKLDVFNLSPEKMAWLSESDLLFARDHITDLEGAPDLDGNPIVWANLSPTVQMRIIKKIKKLTSYESGKPGNKTKRSTFTDFILAYGEGPEKKSEPLVKSEH